MMDVNSPEAMLWAENMRLKSENEQLRKAVAAEREQNAQKCVAVAAKRRGGISFQALECAAAIRKGEQE